jgi:hypothetical protein
MPLSVKVSMKPGQAQVWISDTDIRNHKQGRSQQEKQASNY